ncbi:MAG: hypothetical protein ACI9NC_001182 [Verrucomicrobiales bacterium]|jgi:hypothetical protein
MKTRKLLRGVLALNVVFAIGGLLVAEAVPEPLALDPLMGGKVVWEMSDDDFAKKYIKEDTFGSFEWVSSAKASARLQHLSNWKWTSSNPKEESRSLAPTIGLGEHEVGEVLVRFTDNRVRRVEMSIYNRGDDGVIDQHIYLERLKKISGFLDANLEVRKTSDKASGSSTVHSLLWKTEQSHYLLEYSYNKRSRNSAFRPEFIILKIAPSAVVGRIGGHEKKMKSRGDLEKEVVKEENGDVIIKTVPMVDQGQKGYCAVASAERVMRYYGVDVNQHEMAQISNTTSRGTSGKEMSEALASAAGKYHTRVLTLFEFSYEDRKGWKEMEKVAKSYNRLAKKAKKKEFDIEKYWVPIGRLLSEGDPELLKEVRANGVKYDRFQSKVHSYIDDGVPLLWALYLGVFKEEGLPQSGGGHMRLIIGYNKGSRELIYTDSWGAGHELKRMKMDEAYTMTMQLTVLQPAN